MSDTIAQLASGGQPQANEAPMRTEHAIARRLGEAIDRAMDLGLWEHADRVAATALRLAPSHPSLTERLARLRLAQGRCDLALASIDGCRARTAELDTLVPKWHHMCKVFIADLFAKAPASALDALVSGGRDFVRIVHDRFGCVFLSAAMKSFSCDLRFIHILTLCDVVLISFFLFVLPVGASETPAAAAVAAVRRLRLGQWR